MVMLPFFKTVKEVKMFIELLDTSKVEPTLLIETTSALDNLNDILKLYPFKYVHIGLNDIHIERNTSFMFEPYIDGLLDKTASILRSIIKNLVLVVLVKLVQIYYLHLNV